MQPRCVFPRLSRLRDSSAAESHFTRGVEHFNSCEFFAAHESWEVIWLPAQEPDKTFLQGITQVSAGFYHFVRGNRIGAVLQLSKGLAKLARFQSNYRDIDVATLRLETTRWLTALRAGKEMHGEPFPQILPHEEEQRKSGRAFSLPPESGKSA